MKYAIYILNQEIGILEIKYAQFINIGGKSIDEMKGFKECIEELKNAVKVLENN